MINAREFCSKFTHSLVLMRFTQSQFYFPSPTPTVLADIRGSKGFPEFMSEAKIGTSVL